MERLQDSAVQDSTHLMDAGREPLMSRIDRRTGLIQIFSLSRRAEEAAYSFCIQLSVTLQIRLVDGPSRKVIACRWVHKHVPSRTEIGTRLVVSSPSLESWLEQIVQMRGDVLGLKKQSSSPAGLCATRRCNLRGLDGNRMKEAIYSSLGAFPCPESHKDYQIKQLFGHHSIVRHSTTPSTRGQMRMEDRSNSQKESTTTPRRRHM